MTTTLHEPRVIRAPRGTEISCKGWQQEAALRMLMNNLDPDVAEKPHELVVYGGIGRAARDWESYDRIVSSLKALENALDGGYGQAAAFVMEVVQGPNGHVVFPQPYYEEVQRACRERGVLLIVDEIQTGLARCGAMWASDLFDVHPDILVAGKALGGGVPTGAVIARADLVTDQIESEPWNILTFMNQPLAAAAGMAVLDVVEEESLAERARDLGARATGRFRELADRFDVIGDVRGPGLFVGVDYVVDRESKEPASQVCEAAWEYAVDQGLLCQFGGIGGNVLKFKPPLTTPDEDFERMLELVADVTAFISDRVRGRTPVPA